jgi:hypothetical protein
MEVFNQQKKVAKSQRLAIFMNGTNRYICGTNFREHLALQNKKIGNFLLNLISFFYFFSLS